MTRILVTGAAGMIGSFICEDLLRKGHMVWAVDNLSGGLVENIEHLNIEFRDQFHFFPYDAGDKKTMRDIFMGHRPETVVHCAANAREGASVFSPSDITYNNVMIGATLLELAIKYGMRRFVFFSSMSVYGNQKPAFHEKMPRLPVDPYGVCKTAVEMMIEQLAPVHNFSYVVLRPHNVFGSRQNLQDPYRNVVGIFMNRIMRKEPLYIYGRGHKRAFSYLEDSLPAFTKAILDESINGEIVNVGGKEEISIDEMARVVIDEMLGPRSEYEIIHTEPRYGEVPSAFSTFKKSEEMLGYVENVGWREGVRRMAKWAKRKGGQPWRFAPLPLINSSAPEPWKILNNFKDNK